MTVAQLTADVERFRAALSRAEVRNRELEAQLAEVQSQLAASRTDSRLDTEGLTKAVAAAQARQVAAEERAATLEDELRTATQAGQIAPAQEVQLSELGARVQQLESALQQHAAALRASEARERLTADTLQQALAGKEEQLAGVSKEAESLLEALRVTVDDAEKEREVIRKLGKVEGRLHEERKKSARARDASAARVAELLTKVAAVEDENAEVKRELEGRIGERETAAAEARARIALLEDESARWRRGIAEKTATGKRAAAEAGAEIAALKQTNGRLTRELKEAQGVVPEALLQIEKLEGQLAARGVEVEKSSGSEEKAAAEASETIATLKAELAGRAAEAERLSEERTAWVEELEGRKSAMNAHESAGVAWEKETADKEKEICALTV
ncbi:hypothetical protein KFL_016270010, partial [Klebsormidium nitens]